MNTEKVLNFQIEFERRISRIYERIAEQFSSRSDQDPKWSLFWKELSLDEEDHAALLSIEKALLQTGTRVKIPVEIDGETIENLERLLIECEKQVSKDLTNEEAIQILKRLENYDNRLFSSLLKATDSKLLSRFISLSRRYKAHEKRVREGLGYIESLKRKEFAMVGKEE
ncbi:MAG: hypothetical protein ACE5FY_04575 [Nitrospiria bacterium]